MSETFTDFLRDRAAKYNTNRADRDSVVAEWREALGRLYDRLRECLHDADPDRILTVTEDEWKRREERLGKYTVRGLSIEGLGSSVSVVPVARYTVGRVKHPRREAPERATGRVDLTDEVRRTILYRLPDESGDAWVVEDTNGETRLLDDATFLDALKSFLR